MKGYLLLTLTAVVALCFTSCKKNVVSCLGVTSNVVEVGEPVAFTNCSVNGESYVWSFGDGTTSTESAPTHTYTRVGTYEVTLSTLSKKDKTSDEQTLFVEVVPNTNTTNGNTNGQYRMTYISAQKQRLYNASTMTYRDTTYRDTVIVNTFLEFSEDGSTVYLEIETIFGDCDVQAQLNGDVFSLPAQTPFVCAGSTWNNLEFMGLTGTFSDNGRKLTISYESKQTLNSNQTGVLGLSYSGGGLRLY